MDKGKIRQICIALFYIDGRLDDVEQNKLLILLFAHAKSIYTMHATHDSLMGL
jgi:hypothetical protein